MVTPAPAAQAESATARPASWMNMLLSSPTKREHARTTDDAYDTMDVQDEGCVVEVEQGKLDFLVSLPHELSLSILLCLDYETILTCRAVSRQWCTLASDNLLWRDLFLRQPRWRIYEDALHRGSRSGSDQQRISKLNAAGKLTRRLTDMMIDLGGFALGRSPPPAAATADNRTTDPATPSRQSSGGMSRPASIGTSSRTSISSINSPLAYRSPSSAVLPLHNPAQLAQTSFAETETLDWPKLFKDRHTLDLHWQRGDCKQLVLKGHGDSVYCIQFDDHKIISGSRDKTIKVWDPRTGACVKTLSGHQGSVLCLQYDDEILVTGSSDTTIIIWDLVGGESGRNKWQPIQKLVGHNMGVLDVAFDDDYIVSSSKDTTIRVWNKQSGDLVRLLSGHRGPVNALELLDGRIWSASGDSSVKLWSAATGECLRVFTGHDRGLACIAVTPDGRLFATGSNDRKIKLWLTETGECINTFSGHTDLVRSLAIDENAGRVASASYDNTVRVWDLARGDQLLKFPNAHTSLVFDVALSVSKIISCSHDHSIVIHDFGHDLDVSRFY